MTTKVRPQNLNLKVNSGTELVPSFVGMLHIDTNNILRVDSVGAGVLGDFVTVLPQHTVTGEHGPKVTITQTGDDNALAITKGGLQSAISIVVTGSGAGKGMLIASASNVSQGLEIQQNGNADALHIDVNGSGRAIFTEDGDVVFDNGNVAITNGGFQVNTNRLFVSATRVGVGTTSPDRLLDVNGGAVFRGNHVYINNPSAPVTTRTWGIVNGTVNGILNIGPADDTVPTDGSLNSFPFQIEPNQTEVAVMRITSEGTVGIGTTSPNNAKVEIQQDAGGTAVGLLVDKNTGTGEAISIDNSGTGEDIVGTGGSWSIDKLGNAIFNSVATTFDQTIAVLSWTADATAKSTGALGFTPRYATILFAGYDSLAGHSAMSVGFTTGLGNNAGVAITDNRGASTVDHTVAFDTSVPAGLPTVNVGFESAFNRGQLTVTAFGSGGITLDPTVTITGTAILLIVG